MAYPIGTRLPSPPIITIASRLSVGGAFARIGAGVAATGASPWSVTANSILAFPFVLETQTICYKGVWVNGGTVGSNYEVGIWDNAASPNKIITTGSVAAAGSANVPQAAAFTSTVTLPPGQYYAGIAHNATTTAHISRWSLATTGAAFWQSFGCWLQAGITLGSLAATATPADMTNVAFPLFGIITRTVFDA